jgi:hypothetical protein
MQEQELFETYEIKGWQLSKRLYKIIGVSLVINLVGFVFMAQANFLTGKTCDSPIASGVCSVLDTLYVGGLILDSDATFVSKPYERTEIGDSDEITYVDVSNFQPLTYPVGYFALANPDQQLDEMGNPIITSSEIPGISTSPTGDNLINMAPILPQDNGPVLDGQMPSSPLGNQKQGKTRNLKNNSPNKLPNLGGGTTAENKANPNTTSEPVKLGEINRVPFEDLGDEINAKREKNEVDLTRNFTVVLESTINAEGKFDAKNTKFVRAEGDEQMVEIAKKALQAVGDSGFLGLLKEKGIDKVNITLVQNDNEIYAIVLSDMKKPNTAATTASELNLALQAAKFADDNNIKKLDQTSRVLVDHSTLTSEGKNFRLDFKLPKQDALVIINQTLDKRAQTKSNPPKSEGAVNNNTNATMAK